MVKMALSAMIRQVMPTTPLEGLHSALVSSGTAPSPLVSKGIVAVVVFIECSCHSYFQSGALVCLMSQRGRRLLTVGISAKLYSGGGELVDHSSVQASQGSFPAGRPLRRDRRMFITKMSVPITWNATPIVQMRFQIPQPRPAS